METCFWSVLFVVANVQRVQGHQGQVAKEDLQISTAEIKAQTRLMGLPVRTAEKRPGVVPGGQCFV